eukprot:8199686-Pyramimonas_sp.AAC.1
MDEDEDEETEIPAMPVIPDGLKKHMQDMKGDHGYQAKAFIEQLTAASAKLPPAKTKIKKARAKQSTS